MEPRLCSISQLDGTRRRIQRHLMNVESEVRRLRTEKAAGWQYGDGSAKPIAHLRDVEIPRLEAELRELLASGADVDPV